MKIKFVFHYDIARIFYLKVVSDFKFLDRDLRSQSFEVRDFIDFGNKLQFNAT